MRTVLRSIGLAAVGALAVTVAATQDTETAVACEETREITSADTIDDCNFEMLLWKLVADSGDESDLEAYLEMYPDGRFSGEAKRRLARMLPRYGVLRFAPASS